MNDGVLGWGSCMIFGGACTFVVLDAYPPPRLLYEGFFFFFVIGLMWGGDALFFPSLFVSGWLAVWLSG